MRFIDSEPARFLVAGGTNTLATYLIYLAVLTVADYAVAYSIAFVAGIGIAYCLNARFVFRTRISLRQLLQYPVVYAFQYVAGLILLAFLVEYLGADARFAPLVNVVLLTPLTFLMNRWFLLRNSGR